MGRSGRALGALLLRGCRNSAWAPHQHAATTLTPAIGLLGLTGNVTSPCTAISSHAGASASCSRQASSTAAAQTQPPKETTDQAPSGTAQSRASADPARNRSAFSSRQQGSGKARPPAGGPRVGKGTVGGPPSLTPDSPAPTPSSIKTHGSGRVSDLAMENAPTKILQLIGDPRTGVADDVTSNPFGSTTVDMIHHQASNEVYWFKYEYAAEQLRDTHRDARLSEYSKNLMYLLRAKDPQRWSIDALAHKFRIRPQRVLAILALKEMESHSIEQQQSMQGPLSAYTCTVHLDDVQVDRQGEPLNWDSQVSLAALPDMIRAAADAGKQPESVLNAGRAAAGGSVPINLGDLPLQNSLPRTKIMSAQVGWQLAQLLSRFHDLQAARSQILSEIQAAVAAVQAQLPAEALNEKSESVSDEEAEVQPAAPAPGTIQSAVQLLAALKSQEQAVAALFDALDEVLLQPAASAAAGAEGQVGAGGGKRIWKSDVLQQESQVQESVAQIRPFLTQQPPQPSVTSEALAGSTAEGPAQAGSTGQAVSGSAGTLEAAVAGLTDDLLLHVVARLPVGERVQLLSKVPDAAARLQMHGVDLPALKTQQHFTDKQGKSKASAESGLDVLGFSHISLKQYKQLCDLIQAVESAQATVLSSSRMVSGKTKQLDESSASSSSSSSAEWLRSLVQLNEGYQATSAAVGQLKGHTTNNPSVNKLALLKLMHEADPGVLDRITMVEAARQLEQAGDMATASQVWSKVREASGQPAQPEVQPDPLKHMRGVGDPALGVRGQGVAWDALSAWLEAEPGGRVYHRGTGERQVARLPTYPAFEGQPLSSVDSVEEGVVSALNRQLSARHQQDLDKTFRRDILYNLGLMGAGLWDGSTPKPAANLNTDLNTAPIVLYDISPDGNTVYPPREVVEPDGTRRPLNDKELVWQERRRRMHTPTLSKVHYTMTRVKRKPELE